jgi:hypothetical protein
MRDYSLYKNLKKAAQNNEQDDAFYKSLDEEFPSRPDLHKAGEHLDPAVFEDVEGGSSTSTPPANIKWKDIEEEPPKDIKWKSVDEEEPPKNIKWKDAKVEETPVKDVLSDVWERTKGTGLQIADMLGGAIVEPFALEAGFHDLSQGGSSKQAAKEVEAIREKFSVRAQMEKAGMDPGPTNPVLDKMGQFFQGVGNIAAQNQPEKSRDPGLMAPGNGKPEPFQKQPDATMGSIIASDVAGLAGGIKGTQALDSVIQGRSKRVPDEGNALPPPETPQGPGTAVAAIREQEAFTQQRNNADMTVYNQDPTKFGVTETGINPYDLAGTISAATAMKFDPTDGYHKLVDEPIEELASPEAEKRQPQFKVVDRVTGEVVGEYLNRNTAGRAMDRKDNEYGAYRYKVVPIESSIDTPNTEKRPFTERHKAMVEQGEALLKDMESKGLTPKQVNQQFWQDTYPLLPEEVQVRFQRLLNRQTKKAGGDLTETALNHRLPVDAGLLEGMNKWYVALMHEANNYPWSPKAQALIENRPDLQEYKDAPEAIKKEYWQENGDVFKPMVGSNMGVPQYIGVIKKNENDGSFKEVLEFIKDHSGNPIERIIARAILPANKDIKLSLREEESRAYATADHKTNTVKIFLDPNRNDLIKFRGMFTDTVLHEGMHMATLNLIELGRDSETRKKYPEYARFFDELSDLWIRVQQTLPKEILDEWQVAFYGRIEKQGSLGHEMISYGLTHPAFIRVLDNVYFNPKTKTSAWEDFTKTMGEGLGVPEDIIDKWFRFKAQGGNSAFTELLELIEPLLKADLGFDIADAMAVKTRGFHHSTTFDTPATKKQLAPLAIRPPDPMVPFEFESNMDKKQRDMVDKLVSPYTDYNQFTNSMGAMPHNGGKTGYSYFPDLSRITGNVYPVTTVKNIAGNPLVTYTVTKVRNIYGDAHVLKKFLVETLTEFEEAPQADQNAITTTLNELNRPEIQETLMQARVQQGKIDYRLTDQELVNYGLQGPQIDLYRRVIEPLFEALLKIDRKSMLKGFGRVMDSDVIGYYPRSFGYGKFTLKAFGPNGELIYFRRAPTYKEIRELEVDLNAAGHLTERGQGKDFADFKDHMLALLDIAPKSPIGKLADATIAAAEEHRRTQEFERHAKGVAGFIGQNINNPKEVQLLKQSIYHRIEQTVEAYKAARLLDEVLRPMQEDIMVAHYWPNAKAWVQDVVRRELGGDISLIKPFDNFVQWTFDKTYRTYLKATYKHAYDLKPAEITVNPTASKEVSRYLAASGSAWVLAGNVPNLVTNAFTVPLVSLMGGFPDAQMLRTDPARAVAYATAAHAQSLVDGTMILSGMADPSLKDFIQKVIDRGLGIASAFDDIPQMRAEIEKTTFQRGFDYTLNIPRKWFNDPVEKLTNFTSLLYYNRLTELLFPTMPTKKRFDLTVDLAKGYTGDYARYNKALIFDKLGNPGQMVSNFSIWMGTRTAQFHHLSKEAVKGHLKPLIAIMAAGILVAGIQGAPLMQDYENIRQWGSQNKVFYMPPADLVMREAGAPEWLRNGVILNSFGLDLASRGKWAGFTDVGGVTYLLPGKIWNIANYLYDNITEMYPDDDSTRVQGVTVERTAGFVKSVPTMLQGVARQSHMTRDFRPNDEKTVLSSHGRPLFTQKKGEVVANYLNFRTTRQANEMQEFYNSLYIQNKRQRQISNLKSGAVEQIMMAINAEKRGEKETAGRLWKSATANLINLARLSTTSLNTLSADIRQGFSKEMDTNYEAHLKELARTKDAMRALMLIENIRLMNAKPETPSPSQPSSP